MAVGAASTSFGCCCGVGGTVTAGAFAAYLVILQLFVIDAVCVWCMANDVVLTPIFVVLALARLWTAATENDA